MFFFYFIYMKGELFRDTVIGTPAGIFDEIYKYQPIVTLHFRESEADVDPEYYPVRAQISFRLVGETSQSITEVELKNIARRIKQEFGPRGNPYKWKKGKVLLSYKNKKEGLNLRIAAYSEQERIEVLRKVCNCAGKTLDEKYLSVSKVEDEASAFPIVPKRVTILGKPTRLPRRRPVATVQFSHALCKIWGRRDPGVLHDAGYQFRYVLSDD
ncbi:MAG: hypothetical protein QXS29_10120 [Nitrososphaeria archaeon]